MFEIKSIRTLLPLLEGRSESAGLSQRLTLADDRNAWFEAIRDPHDRLLQDWRKPLTPEDYLGKFPQSDPLHSSQTRLYALKQRIEQFRLQQEKEKLQQEKYVQFVKGLMG